MAKKVNLTKETENLEQVLTQEQQTPPNIPQMPEVRAVPTWSPDANISVTGMEWEAIHNGLVHMQVIMQAVQAVMSRNIMDNTIELDYEKLNSKTLQYEKMTDEEKAPYIENFNKAKEAIKNQK